MTRWQAVIWLHGQLQARMVCRSLLRGPRHIGSSDFHILAKELRMPNEQGVSGVVDREVCDCNVPNRA